MAAKVPKKYTRGTGREYPGSQESRDPKAH